MGKIFSGKMTGILVVLLMLAGSIAGCGEENDQTVKIGVVYELTGNAAGPGNAAANGAKLAFKEINARGGVLGKQIEIVVVDNKGEPSEAAKAMTKVISKDNVIAVTGFTVSSNVIAASNVAESSKIPLVAAATIGSEVTVDEKTGKVKDYVFRGCPIESFRGAVGAKFAMNTLKAGKVAVMVDSGSDCSKDMAQVFKEEFAKGSGSIVAEEAYVQNDQDFKAMLTKIKAVNPDMIYLPGSNKAVGKIVSQARELGINVPFVGGEGWDLPSLAEVGGPAMKGTYFVTHYSAEDTNPASKAFSEAYQKEYGQSPDAMAALGYDAACVLVDAIKRAGSLEPDKIRAALVATKNFPVITGVLTINTIHDAEKSGVIMEYRDGKMVYNSTVQPE